MDVLGPLCRDFGAPFILLPIEGARLPKKAAERIRTVESLLARAEGLGIPRRLMMVDVLALAVSSSPDGARQCLEMVHGPGAAHHPGAFQSFLRPARAGAAQRHFPLLGGRSGAHFLHCQPLGPAGARGCGRP